MRMNFVLQSERGNVPVNQLKVGRMGTRPRDRSGQPV